MPGPDRYGYQSSAGALDFWCLPGSGHVAIRDRAGGFITVAKGDIDVMRAELYRLQKLMAEGEDGQ